MWFWITIAAVLVVLWLLAWRVDRRRKGVSFARGNHGLDRDVALGQFEARRNQYGEGGGAL